MNLPFTLTYCNAQMDISQAVLCFAIHHLVLMVLPLDWRSHFLNKIRNFFHTQSPGLKWVSSCPSPSSPCPHPIWHFDEAFKGHRRSGPQKNWHQQMVIPSSSFQNCFPVNSIHHSIKGTLYSEYPFRCHQESQALDFQHTGQKLQFYQSMAWDVSTVFEEMA